MKYLRFIFITTLFMILMAGCASASGAAPTQVLVTITMFPSSTPSLTYTPTIPPTATPTVTETPEPTSTPSPTPAPVTLVGAADISYCGEQFLGDEATAKVLAAVIEQYPDVQIFTAGDNVQGKGIMAEYLNCFTPSWGQFKERIHPAPGNHDYMTNQGAPYYTYFGAQAGEAGQGYYSYDMGEWHIIALNSNCNDIGCREGSRQVEWLRQDLENNNKRCTMMYWHHPRFSSGHAGNYGSVYDFWRIGMEYGVEMVVSGHDHGYERFAPQDIDGKATTLGIRQFVVGTGGATLRDWGEVKPNSEIRDNETNGVIKFTLYPDRYEWEFLPSEGGTFTDSGSGVCH